MTKKFNQDIIIIAVSNGKNLELSKQFLEKSKNLDLNCEIMDLTLFNFPLFNPRLDPKDNIPKDILNIKEKLSTAKSWIICSPEYNGSIPPIFSNLIAWLSISGDDFRDLFNGRPIAITTFSGGPGLELLISLRMQLVHLGSQVLGRQLSANFSKPANASSIEDLIKRLSQMKRLELDI